MPRLSQKFTSLQAYLDELERIGKRWVTRPAPSYDIPRDMLPRGL